MHPLTVLNRELAARGFHRKPTARLLAELALLLAMAAGGAAAYFLVHGIVLKAAALLVMALGNLGITTHTHSSSHNGTSPRLWVNKALTLFGYGVWFGTSAHYWWNKHVAVHHATPNVVGLDDDVDLLPWFALTEEQFQEGGPLRRAYYRVQWLVVPLAVGLTALNMIRASWVYLAEAVRDPRRRTPLWQQRQRAAHLLQVASGYGSFPIVLETMRECLQDVFDVPGLATVMRDLRSRSVRLVEVTTTQPSPFARSLLFGYVAQFLYEGDSPLAERRAAALSLDPTL
ncbi:MAG TPA: hypothetical protein VGO40_13560, partial [Longimicrobium sp.]|nr:hypothetical protein [Longimicrobium sp.]